MNITKLFTELYKFLIVYTHILRYWYEFELYNSTDRRTDEQKSDPVVSFSHLREP